MQVNQGEKCLTPMGQWGTLSQVAAGEAWESGMWGRRGIPSVQEGGSQPCWKLQPAASLGLAQSWGHTGDVPTGVIFVQKANSRPIWVCRPLQKGLQPCSRYHCPTPKLQRDPVWSLQAPGLAPSRLALLSPFLAFLKYFPTPGSHQSEVWGISVWSLTRG